MATTAMSGIASTSTALATRQNDTTVAMPSDGFQRPTRRPLPKAQRQALEEETYVAALETIIQRDFYPELTKLQAQRDYLEAMEANDLERMRAISTRFSTPRPPQPDQQANRTAPSAGATPEPHAAAGKSRRSSSPAASANAAAAAPFETPDRDATPRKTQRGTLRTPDSRQQDPDTDRPAGDATDDHAVSTADAAPDTSLSLDAFLQRYSSEDNASFETMLEAASSKLKARFESYYTDIKSRALQPARAGLTGDEAKAPGVSYALDHWKNTVRNPLMFTPEPLGYTRAELVALSQSKGTVVNHANTRFRRAPFGERSGKSGGIGNAGSSRSGSNAAFGSFGAKDGGETPGMDSQSPRVNGYGYVATPSPMPGRDVDPLLTWGEVAGQAFPLDGSDVAAASGPVFNVQAPSPRESLAHSMAASATRRKAAAASNARRARTPSGNASGGGARTPRERLASLSPAAQRLAKTMGAARGSSLGAALQRTATASPAGVGASLGWRRTPRLTPRLTPRSDAVDTSGLLEGSEGSTSGSVSGGRSGGTPGRGLTDNLL